MPNRGLPLRAAGQPAVQLTLVRKGTVQQHVSGADGRSLYRFDEDTAIPSVSHCAGECAGKWPGLTARRDQMVYAAGVDPQLIGCIQRADGAYRVTLGGWPLYYYANDMKADELLG
jgi:predicted lipoprotein with Yx(FWY)xxD motif